MAIPQRDVTMEAIKRLCLGEIVGGSVRTRLVAGGVIKGCAN